MLILPNFFLKKLCKLVLNLNPLNNFFSDTKEAFSLKSNFELNRAYFLFNIIGNSTFVKITTSLTKFALRFHLPVTPIIKATVFDHFCGGVTEEDCISNIEQMHTNGVCSVLDYSVEGKETEEQFKKGLFTLNDYLLSLIHI